MQKPIKLRNKEYNLEKEKTVKYNILCLNYMMDNITIKYKNNHRWKNTVWVSLWCEELEKRLTFQIIIDGKLMEQEGLIPTYKDLIKKIKVIFKRKKLTSVPFIKNNDFFIKYNGEIWV